jgi:hypothetical protein
MLPPHPVQGAEHFADFAARRAGEVAQHGGSGSFASLAQRFQRYQRMSAEERQQVVQAAIAAAESLQAAAGSPAQQQQQQQFTRTPLAGQRIVRMAPEPARTTPSAHAASEASTSDRSGQSNGASAHGQQQPRQQAQRAQPMPGPKAENAHAADGVQGRQGSAGQEAAPAQQRSAGFTSSRHGSIWLMSVEAPAGGGQLLAGADLGAALLEGQPQGGRRLLQASSPMQARVGEEEEFSVGSSPGMRLSFP